jgi:preprotein translocase subunit SecA
VSNVLTRLGMQEGEAIESGMVTRRIEKAQKKVEEHHFDQRKNLLEYDEVMDYQRKRVYGSRQEVLDGKNPRAMVVDMIEEQVDKAVDKFLDDNYGPASFAEFASNRLGVEYHAAEFRGDYEDSYQAALTKALDQVPTVIQELTEENLNPDEDPSDWKWSEMSRALNARYTLKTTEKDLKKVSPQELTEKLVKQAQATVKAVDLTDGKRFLARNYGAESLADWLRQKFAVKLPVEEIAAKSESQLKTWLVERVREAYRNKDLEFPVRVAMQNYMSDKAASGGGQRFDRDGLFNWSMSRLGPALAAKSGAQAEDQAGFFAASRTALEGEGFTEEFVRTEPRSQLREKLVGIAKNAMPQADLDAVDARVDDIFTGARTAEAEDAKELADWAKSALGLHLDPAKLTGLTRDAARDSVLNAYDAKYRPEMHSVERGLVLEQLDSAWKTHLLSMDNLRSGVGLRGYAQEDPKIVYKREGMREFDTMWEGVRDRVTEAVFRMEDLGDEEAQMALWAGARATQEAAISLAQTRSAQADAASQQTNAGGEVKKTEPIRNTGSKVSRNDPCPCGSGKKYKNCHMKLEARN